MKKIKEYELWEGKPETGECLWEANTYFDKPEPTMEEYEDEKTRLETENPDKEYTIVVRDGDPMDYYDNTPDPEERHWANMTTWNERFSDNGSDY